MIDGVKIEVSPKVVNSWRNNPLLVFKNFHNENTGEILGQTSFADHEGLKFFIRRNKETGLVTQCEIRGSLHKFYNNGQSNANDFTFSDLQETISLLEKQFDVIPETAILHNVEIGVNVFTPVTAKDLFKHLISYKNKNFQTIQDKHINIGKQIGQKRKKYKAYDKGKTENLDYKNLVRFEVAISEMSVLRKYDIFYLSDLLDINKVKPLINILTDWWDNLIYYDRSINITHLTVVQQKRVLQFSNPVSWLELKTPKQRYRAKKIFFEMVKKYGSTNHYEIGQIIRKKWCELSAEKWVRLGRGLSDSLSDKMGMFGELEYSAPTYPKILNPNVPQKEHKTHTETLTVCKSCGKDISHKRSNARYFT